MSELIPLAEQIDAILPQTQCTKCGYQGCKPYAEAIAAGDAINKCPPGGQHGIEQLAALLHRPVVPLDTTHGEEPTEKRVAFIREAECIGCTKCIQACPVDAILGAAKLMHTVISDICTGCDLCVAPCPVDCIDMIPAAVVRYPDAQSKAAADKQKADLSRLRFQKRNARLQRLAREKEVLRQVKTGFQPYVAAGTPTADNAQMPPGQTSTTKPTLAVQDQVQAALAAVRARAAAQPMEEQRAKLERAISSALERFERANAKVQQATKNTPEQLPALCARREDMRFKLEEARKKLAELDNPGTSNRFNEAVARITTLRSQKPDAARLANGLAIIRQKLQETLDKVPLAQGEEKLFLEEDIQRLQAKLAEAEKALADLSGSTE